MSSQLIFPCNKVRTIVKEEFSGYTMGVVGVRAMTRSPGRTGRRNDKPSGTEDGSQRR